MKKIKKILWEIESSLKKVNLFFVLIKALVIFSILSVFTFIMGLPSNIAFIPAIVYLVSSIFIEARIDHAKIIEDNFSNLKEKLITARDYKDEENPILESLEQDIVSDLKKVELSKFVPYSRLVLLIVVLLLSVTTSLYLASKEVKLLNFNDIIEDARQRFLQDENESIEDVDFSGTEQSIMKVGTEIIEVEINPIGMDLDFQDVSDTGDYEFSTIFPRGEFIASGTDVAGSEYTREQQELITRYFQKKVK